jgi:UDP-N-acetylglucosamine enolpyruvyl transferase
MNASVEWRAASYCSAQAGGLIGAQVYFDVVSVGAT